MDFYTILDQVVDLLRHRKRVTYRALQRQFHLDDACLSDLKAELIEAQHLATDEDGNVLVWIGDTEATAASSVPQTESQSRPQQAQTSPSAPVSLARPVPDAERRQLTVMFCDLVDSTVLSGQLDPEDLREVVRAYQAACAEVIQRFEGHIAQYLGDGLLVYFGYPQAHEDDAQRAVRTGLGIVETLDMLNSRLGQEKGVRLAVRVGIHTGLVVVGEMGGGGRQEQLALGDTPNIAARLQGLAAPDTVVISAATQRLIQGYFTCHALVSQMLKGVATPIQVHQVMRETEVQQRFDVVAARGLTPLVGREHEVGILRERWAQVQAGRGHIVVLSGEAGIGKSRLVQVVKDEIIDATTLRLEYRCSPYHQHSALYPVIAHLERALAFHQDDTPADKLRKLEEALRLYPLPLAEGLPLFAALLSVPLPASYPPLTLTPQRQKQKTLEALLTWLLALTEQQPLLFVVEDLHWIDPSTLEFLTLLVDQGPTARLLTLLTCRPEFQPPWGLRTHLTPIALQRLSQPQVEAMVARVTGGKALPPAVLQHVVTKTDGVPLFVEELTKTVLESGLLRETEEHYELTGPLPHSLAHARCLAAWVSQLRRDVPAVYERAEAAVALSTEQGFPQWAAFGTSLRGWALALQGQGEEGIAQVRQGIAAWRATGAATGVPFFCPLLAEVCDNLGHTADGLQALAEAHTLVEQHEERWWEAEVYRLRGVLLLRQTGTPQAEAETWLQRALDVARRQEAKSLELRAAMSLARLWQQQSKRAAAYELLAPIYGWFTEGFDTTDLQEAKALLETLEA